MRNWQVDAPLMIAAIHKSMLDCSPDELRKELRKQAWYFHGGTSWGKKVWSKHCRAYMAKLTGNGHYSGNGKAVDWPADICFPFHEAGEVGK
jgi:hypothetical protein